MTITIRTTTLDDAPALSKLAVQTFSDTFGYLYTPENLAAHLRKTCSPEFFAGTLAAGDVIHLAFSGSEMIGYAKCGHVGLPIASPPDNAREIHRLYVTQPFQAQGIGRLLMDAVLETPVMKSATLYLGVWENNTRAQEFYAHYGFSPVGEYTYYVGTHADREIILSRPPQ